MHLSDLLRDWELVKLLIPPCGLLVLSQAMRHKAFTRHDITRYKKAAQNPPVPKRWKRKFPEGIVIGECPGWQKEFFVIPTDECLSGLIFGGSGSGKTTGPLLCTLLSNLERRQEAKERPDLPDHSFTHMTVDLKGELHAMMPKDSYYLIDPEDRPNSVGWDPYYRLNREQEPSDDLKMQVFSGIAESFVPKGSDDAAFFTENAAGLLAGFLCWGYEHQYGFIDMVQKILGTNPKELLEGCLKDCDEDSVAFGYLAKITGADESEAFQNFYSEMVTKLSCCKLQSVQYILRDNPVKIGPNKVRENDVFLAVPDHMLTEPLFSPIIRLILEQTMTYLTLKLPPKGTRPVMICIDELFAVGGGTRGKGVSGLEKFLSIHQSN